MINLHIYETKMRAITAAAAAAATATSTTEISDGGNCQ